MAYFLKRAGLEMIPVGYEGGATRWSASVAVTFPSTSRPCRRHAAGNERPHPAARRLERQARGAIRRRADLRRGGFPGAHDPGLERSPGAGRNANEIVRRIAAGDIARRQDPNIGLARYGAEPLANTPAEFTAMIAADVAFWGEAVRTAGVLDK